MKIKKQLTVIFPNVLGGVSSFYANLINSKGAFRKEFDIHAILIQDIEDKRPNFKGELNAENISEFRFSNKENQYFVCKRLNSLLLITNGLVVCDHYLVLNTISCFKYEKLVFHLLHDYYYVQQNIIFSKTIDYSIAHSSFFKDCILAWNSKEYINRAHYIPYGVKIPKKNQKPVNAHLNVVFLGRLTPMKGVRMLKQINDETLKLGVEVNWTIIGQGELKEELLEDWSGKDNIRFIQPIQLEELYTELQKQDVFVFPTLFEGTPVSIFEALANGIVPVVNDLPGGIREHVNEKNGFRVSNSPEVYAQIISELDKNRELLAEYQERCFDYARNNLNLDANMNLYFRFFKEQSEIIFHEKSFDLPSFSRLDKPYIPNFIVKKIRSIR